MAANNTVTLTFAGDSSRLDKTFRDVQAGGDKTTTSLKHAERGVKDLAGALEKTTHSARGTADVMDGFSTVLGGSAGKALMATRGIADLTDGIGVLNQKLNESTSKWAAVGKGVGIAALAVGAFTLAAEAGTWFGNKLNDMLGRGADAADKAAAALYREADAAMAAQQHTLELNKLVTSLNFHSNNGQYGPNDAQIQGPVPFDKNGGILNSTNGGNSYVADQAEKSAARIAAALHKVGSAGGSAAKGISNAAQAAKQALGEWQTVLDKFRGIAKGITDALAPKLEAGDRGLILFPGASALDKLKKQLADTLHLKSDLAKLAKGGLSSDLLSSLVAGGLDSLPVADEILGGGKKGIRAFNSTAAAINAAGGKIAGAEAQRQFNGQITVHQKVDVTGGDGDLKKLVRKWLRTDDGFRRDVKLAVA